MLGFTFLVSSLDFSRSVSRSAYQKSLQNLMAVKNEELIGVTEALSAAPRPQFPSKRFTEFGSFEQYSRVAREAFYERRGKSASSPGVGIEPQFMWSSCDQFE
jgi:hypothetical protein